MKFGVYTAYIDVCIFCT